MYKPIRFKTISYHRPVKLCVVVNLAKCLFRKSQFRQVRTTTTLEEYGPSVISAPVTQTEPVTCRLLNCHVTCVDGFKKDENGCDICR